MITILFQVDASFPKPPPKYFRRGAAVDKNVESSDKVDINI